MKNEMFYGLSWVDVSIEVFIQIIHDYMHWYREKRIKNSLGGMSPLEYSLSSFLSAPPSVPSFVYSPKLA